MRTDPADADAIEVSLGIAAERGGDLTPIVYACLFEREPDMKALFWRDTHHTIKGEMLMRTFESILDFIRARQFADHLVQTEVVAHAKFVVPPGGVRHFLRHRRRNCAGGLRRGLVVRHGGPRSLSRAP